MTPQEQDLFDELTQKNEMLRAENEYLQSIPMTQWAMTVAPTEDGRFISRTEGRDFIINFNDYNANPDETVAFFVDTQKLLTLITCSKPANANGEDDPFVIPDDIQIILAKRPLVPPPPPPSSPFLPTMVIVGSMKDQRHVFCNNQVLEYVWPERAGGSAGNQHASCDIMTK